MRDNGGGRANVDLTVVTPSYGYAHYLPDAVDSVAGQRGITVEHVIQDGGSTDGTVELLERLGDAVEWVSEPDDGQSDALNRAIARAHGRWIAWLNADEFYLPDGLAALVAEGERTGADVVYGDTLFCDGEGRLTRLLPQHRFSPFVLRSYGCYISTVSSIVRRTTLGAQPIDASMRRMMDWDLYLRLLAEDAAFRHVPVPVGVFRAHDTRVTATERRGFFQRLNRGDGFGREYDMVRERYGAMRARRLGHLAHGALKVADGAYARQLRARRLEGAELRWFRSEAAVRDWERVSAGCYPTRDR
ncbi:MAG TPA: glycosyltransferase family 2 protein [Gaiellales bacterium]|nr:glycosyltransferase family 2 protein [Gaiellales bacterium]